MNFKSTLFFFFSLVSFSLYAQVYVSNSNYYYHCQGANCHFNNNNTIQSGIYTIDTLVQKLGIRETITISEKKHKEQYRLDNKRILTYDTLGRTIKTSSVNRYGDWDQRYDYSQPLTIIQHGNLFYSKVVFNDSNYVISNYYESQKENGKIKMQRLTKFTYNNYKWVTSGKRSDKKKETTLLRFYFKNYYQNDTGDLIKAEYFSKGKLNYTRIYECNLQDNAPPIKDTSIVCLN